MNQVANGQKRCGLSFVVLNYNDAQTTISMVDGLCRWKSPLLDMHIIVVDNCSMDNSFQELSDHFSSVGGVDVLLAKCNGGYSYGNNYGSRYAIQQYSPEYIAIANPDIGVKEETVLNLLDTFTVDDKIAICSPVMKTTSDAYQICSQTLPSWKDDLKACRLRDKSSTLHMEGYETLDEAGNIIVTDMLPGSFFVIRTSVFEEIGFLDENVFLYCEERILGRKLKDAGYKAVLRGDLFYVHAHAVTISKSINVLNRQKLMLKSRYYYQKEYGHCSKPQLILLRTAMKAYILELSCLLWLKSKKAIR